MRLLQAIIEANHRAAAGDAQAGLHPVEFEDSLPLVALTCIDARLNPLLPGVLGVPEESFIWLRNAGNVITGPLSSTMRSLALACAVKGGREIAIIGHTHCLVSKVNVLTLTEAFQRMGVTRDSLPDNLNEYFGLFASESQNVIKAVETVRSSPLIGPRIPVHGLVVDINTGRLDWLMNGYEAAGRSSLTFGEAVKETAVESTRQAAAQFVNLLESKFDQFKSGELKFPEVKIGEIAFDPSKWLERTEVDGPVQSGQPDPMPLPAPTVPPKIIRRPIRLQPPWKPKA